MNLYFLFDDELMMMMMMKNEFCLFFFDDMSLFLGGVVIVYERKVKLLYEDVTRLLLEITEAWKRKPITDPTVLPKGKSEVNLQPSPLTKPFNQAMVVNEAFNHFEDVELCKAFKKVIIQMYQETLRHSLVVAIYMEEVSTSESKRVCVEIIEPNLSY
ncbi:hypothetical protein GIB67_036896 [Kingdonia uniflora]|uniref:Rad21/Rec8-like protein N-terminal domain-containing protein n=1 Tax=Kingdonia uniflora TaxID=39325 RepID=A0A7J7KV22_9MAGN|nr:hypothetical protein GIB67_036896 [Kingdonia uniflora]